MSYQNLLLIAVSAPVRIVQRYATESHFALNLADGERGMLVVTTCNEGFAPECAQLTTTLGRTTFEPGNDYATLHQEVQAMVNDHCREINAEVRRGLEVFTGPLW